MILSSNIVAAPIIPTPTILISNAEGSKHLINYPPLSQSGCGVLLNLPSTDAVFYGNGPDNRTISIGVEVKSLSDLLTSLQNGRLFATQVPKLLAAHDVCRLVFYGVFRCNLTDNITLQEYRTFPARDNRPAHSRWVDFKLGPKSPIRYGYLISRLDKLARLGVLYDHVPDISHVALWLACLARSYAKPYSEQTEAYRAFDQSRDTPPARLDLDSTTLQIAKLCAKIPGVGWDRAFALAEHFPSYLAICLATPAELAEVATVSADGKRVRFGLKLAESIYNTIRAVRPGCRPPTARP